MYLNRVSSHISDKRGSKLMFANFHTFPSSSLLNPVYKALPPFVIDSLPKRQVWLGQRDDGVDIELNPSTISIRLLEFSSCTPSAREKSDRVAFN